MNKAPNILTFEDLSSAHENQTEINGKWVPARPLGLFSFHWRLKLAWMVFTGKADAFTWPECQ